MLSLEINSSDHILIVAPHPDDECIGTGGLIYLYADKCDIWVMTDGRHGKEVTSEITDFELSNIRKKEFIDEMKKLNIKDYRLFGIEDGKLMDNLDILNSEDLSKYTKIFVTNENDLHDDHRAAFKIVMNALIVQECQNIEIYQYEVTNPLSNTSHFLDISDAIQNKLNLINFHKSQLKGLNYCGLASSINMYRAMQAAKKQGYFESYLKIDISSNNEQTLIESRLYKNIQINKIYDLWLQRILENKNIAEYLKIKGYKNIAIYGFGNLGKRLYDNILNTKKGINISCVIDRALSGTENKINIVDINDNIPDVDIAIVTCVNDFEKIKAALNNKDIDNVTSLYDILNEM